MELPVLVNGNRYVVVLQDVLTKWPIVYLTPDQLLFEEVTHIKFVATCYIVVYIYTQLVN